MVRLITCIRRRSGLTTAEFIARWDDPLTLELYDRVVAALQPEKFARHRTLVVQMNIDLMQQRQSDAPFDAVVEWWYKSAAQFEPRLGTPDARSAMEALLDHQRSFIDIARSPSFFTFADDEGTGPAKPA